tara:strand:- start:509 stop:1351 length:843 start_codon:yes stop_codon:yes gene_type:complete
MYKSEYIINNKFEKIVIIGDIHGDLKRLKNILINENVINNKLQWLHENIMVIQMGDQIDSLNRINNIEEWELIQDIEVLNFTNLLSKIAKEKNSYFISIIGNHELMNIMGNFSYVSQNSLYKERINNFQVKGIYNQILCNRPIVFKVNNLLFCHAGIIKNHLDILDKYNKDIFYLNEIWSNYVLTGKVEPKDREIFYKLIFDTDSILWHRIEQSKEDINYILNKLQLNYIFIGHNTVDNIMIKDNICYTDNGISRSYGREYYQYLVIDSNNNVNVSKINI